MGESVSKPILAFDVDGVLVDVTESYRATIAQTVARFTGRPISHAEIQDYKNRGNANNDWLLTHEIIRERGIEAPFEEVKEHFQKLFLGNGSDGLMRRERWIPRPGLLEGLAERFRLAVFTGRPRADLAISLARFVPAIVFDPIVAMEDVLEPKPAPDGLFRIFDEFGAGRPCPPFWEGRHLHDGYYFGDSVDDARAARAASIRFVGILAPSNPRYGNLALEFEAEGAHAIIDDVNCMDRVFK
jgi:HAD superfamily hydrolase (TIGR01548 family)